VEDHDERVAELERRAEIEYEKLGVAEDLGWAIAAFAALAAYLKWPGWVLPIIIFIGTYYLVTYPYRRREEASTDAYQRASGTGKYFIPPAND